MNFPTTLFVNNQSTPFNQCEKCHDGVGPFRFKDILGQVKGKQFVKYVHDDLIPPGSTFGDHPHRSGASFEEWYLCLSGEGVMTLDGKDYPMKPGDISVCYDQGSHGIRNTGKEDLRILVIGAAAI